MNLKKIALSLVVFWSLTEPIFLGRKLNKTYIELNDKKKLFRILFLYNVESTQNN